MKKKSFPWKILLISPKSTQAFWLFLNVHALFVHFKLFRIYYLSLKRKKKHSIWTLIQTTLLNGSETFMTISFKSKFVAFWIIWTRLRHNSYFWPLCCCISLQSNSRLGKKKKTKNSRLDINKSGAATIHREKPNMSYFVSVTWCNYLLFYVFINFLDFIVKWKCFHNYFSFVLRICSQVCAYLLPPVEKLFKIKANESVLQPATSIDRATNLLILSINHE